jgi:hypothetical protein
MAAVFRQAAFVKRQPSWIGRKLNELFEWIAHLFSGFGASRT